MLNELFLSIAMTISPVQLDCLAKNIYFESRSQSDLGQIAVSHVVLNRVRSSDYPNTICEVVHQGIKSKISKKMIRNKCQFSWYCDGISDKPLNEVMWQKAHMMAYTSIVLYENFKDLTNGSTHYHATHVNPRWARSFKKIVQIDDHIFYKEEK